MIVAAAAEPPWQIQIGQLTVLPCFVETFFLWRRLAST